MIPAAPIPPPTHRSLLARACFLFRRSATPSLAAPLAVTTTDVSFDGCDERVEALIRPLSRLGYLRYLRFDRSDPRVVALLHFGQLNLGFHKFTVPSRQGNKGVGLFAENFIVPIKSLVDPLNVHGKLALLLEDELYCTFHLFMSHRRPPSAAFP